MSSITGISSITGLTTIQNLGVEPDITPNAVNWNGLAYDGGSPEDNIPVTSRQIAGINQSITLKVGYSSSTGDIYYKVTTTGNNEDIFLSEFEWLSAGFTLISNNGEFSVNNNDYVKFAVYPSINYVGFMPQFTVTITNVTDSNTVIDTFTASGFG